MPATARTTWTLPCAFLFAVAACSPGARNADATTDTATHAATPASNASDEAAVRASIDKGDAAWADAMKKGDAAAAAATYSPDAISYQPNTPPAEGAAAIERMYKGWLGMGKVTAASTTTESVTIAGDKAFELGKYDITMQPAGGKAPIKDSGHYVNVWRKQPDGSWKVYRDLVVSSTPSAPAPSHAAGH